MQAINRNVNTFKDKNFDAIIIGGGIYGVMISLVASLKGLNTILLERDDFGGATSYNSLRIIHGGLRYLQKMDISRFLESVAERKWFLKNFPDLVSPLPCLMPLYGKGLYRNSIFSIALKLNDILSVKRNSGLADTSILHSGKIISPKKVKIIFPDVNMNGLQGGAVWNDASMTDSQRVLIETMKWACSMGASALNYTEVEKIIKDENRVIGISATNTVTGEKINFYSNIVINASGPWSRELATSYDKEYKNLFMSSIAWNVLINKKALSDHAVAITPDKPNAKTFFLRPWKGMLFAGTVHQPWKGVEKHPLPTRESVNDFIDDLNLAVNNLNLKPTDILHIYAGLLPAKAEGSDQIAVREVILNHSKTGGPEGLYSVSGVKFTTARKVAEKLLNIIFKDKPTRFTDRTAPDQHILNIKGEVLNENEKLYLQKIIDTESVIHLDDLILRRTAIGDIPEIAMKLSPQICNLFGWNEMRSSEEIERLKNFYNQEMFVSK